MAKCTSVHERHCPFEKSERDDVSITPQRQWHECVCRFFRLTRKELGAVSIEVNGGTYGIRTGLSVAGEYGVGSSVFDARVPAIAWVLGRIASTLDVLPTLAKLAGVVAFKRVTPIKACLCFTHCLGWVS